MRLPRHRSNWSLAVRASLVGMTVLCGGCTADIQGQPSPSNTAGTPVAVGPGGTAPSASVADGSEFFPGAAEGVTKTRIWQLTPLQYITTLRDALGVPVELPRLLPTAREDHFLNDANALAVSEVYFADLEEDLRAQLVVHQNAVTARLTCTVTALDAACARTLLSVVGAVAQGTASPNVEPAMQVFMALTGQAGARAALDDALLALLMAPSVLFRTELGPQDVAASTQVSLTPVELSKALAYAITDAPPDQALRNHAASADLANPQVFAAELQRLLASPRGQDGAKHFLLDWLGLASFGGLEKDPNLFPEFTAQLKDALLHETETFVDHVLSKRGGSFADLMTLEQSFVGPEEATLYGLQAVNGPAELTVLPAGQRMGVFTQPAVLAAISDPALSGVIFRGKFVVERLLCMTLVRPEGLVIEFPDFAALGLGPDSTDRERLATVENMAVCGGCHKVMHPPGFALEHYDAIGRYRTEIQGKPIDASGALTFSRFTQAPFTDATQMLRTMSDSPEVHACLARQAFRYVFGRSEVPTDDPIVRETYRQFTASRNLGALLPQLVASSAFALRQRPMP